MTKSYREQGLDYREDEELSWCPSWSYSLWQGWSCWLVHCPGGNVTDPIWRVLASSDGISSWTPLKPQHSNPNPSPNPLANQLLCINFLTPPTPLIIPHRFPAFLKSLMPLKDWCTIHARWAKSSLWHFFQVWTWNHKIGQSFYKMYSNNRVNFQESTTILNACTKKVWKIIEWPHIWRGREKHKFHRFTTQNKLVQTKSLISNWIISIRQ